jgi:hypothetical protein
MDSRSLQAVEQLNHMSELLAGDLLLVHGLYKLRHLGEQRYLVLMLDGIEVADHTVVVALGITDEARISPWASGSGQLRTPPSNSLRTKLCFPCVHRQVASTMSSESASTGRVSQDSRICFGVN